MNHLLSARSLMGMSLGFHIIFAVVGMVMPFFMVISHWIWIRTRKPLYLQLTQIWSKGVAVLFATGAVSGTVLSFELGLLWPGFMKHAGAIIGMPFSLEGTAFFIEAIAIGLFLYGWKRIPERVHWLCGLLVGLSGILSGIFVVAANAWMNSPSGFEWVNGVAINIDPIAALFNPAWLSQSLHMVIAAFIATGFGVAGIHAFFIIRNPASQLHTAALKIALSCACVAALLQPLSGDFSAKDVAKRQPIKFAAMEGHFHTETGAPLILGGIPDETTQTVKYAIKVPYMLSVLRDMTPHSTVPGLSEFPRENWPPVAVVHIAFQVMVGCGLILVGVSLWSIWILIRKRPLNRPFLWTVTLTAPLGFMALEAGWVVTEVGRQPWIIYDIMRTQDAVTPMPGLWVPLVAFAALYLMLAVMVVALLTRLFQTTKSL